MGKRYLWIAVSTLCVILSLGSIVTQGLVFGLDFTGGTLIEVDYSEPVELENVRKVLHGNGFPDAVVQYFGTTRDVSIRLGMHTELDNQNLSNHILGLLRKDFGQADRLPDALKTPSTTSSEIVRDEVVGGVTVKESTLVETGNTPLDGGSGKTVEMRRVEFVGPQVGEELVEQGGLALLYTLIGILIYIAIRYEFRFAVGAVLALFHDPIIVIGVFSLFRIEFDLTVVAAVLAIIGYSINDTVVVFDRIRDNFRKLRKQSTVEIMNISINQTLSRTVMTSFMTLLVVVVLFVVGGELIRGFSLALIVGIIVGTYSSIYIASAFALLLGVSKADLMPVQKEGADLN
ncbi:MAG: protein-export membrane protein SecF [Beggiatoa sp. IS2]|nr:MAG: protein-export membrane protein SecF [Beggiatoa sp. IS2]